MNKASLSNQEKFFLFCLLLFVIGLVLVSTSWNANSLFSNAYQPVVEKSKRMHQIEAEQDGVGGVGEEEKPSAQPRAAGMREEDINKTEGDGYRTY